MENFNKINSAQICCVKSHLKMVCSYYKFRKERNFLFWKRREGFLYLGYIHPCLESKEEIEKDKRLYCEGQKVYYKPHLTIYMSNQNQSDKYFETKEELFAFMAQTEMKNIQWINL